MRYIFYFWFLPMGLFWGWFGLSANDINLGTLFFSRAMHDLVFQIYANTLGIEKATVIQLLVKACIVDTVLIFSIFGIRKRAAIMGWWRNRKRAMDVSQPVAE